MKNIVIFLVVFSLILSGCSGNGTRVEAKIVDTKTGTCDHCSYYVVADAGEFGTKFVSVTIDEYYSGKYAVGDTVYVMCYKESFLQSSYCEIESK